MKLKLPDTHCISESFTHTVSYLKIIALGEKMTTYTFNANQIKVIVRAITGTSTFYFLATSDTSAYEDIYYKIECARNFLKKNYGLKNYSKFIVSVFQTFTFNHPECNEDLELILYLDIGVKASFDKETNLFNYEKLYLHLAEVSLDHNLGQETTFVMDKLFQTYGINTSKSVEDFILFKCHDLINNYSNICDPRSIFGLIRMADAAISINEQNKNASNLVD